MTISITKSSRIVALAVGAGLVLAVAFGSFAAPAYALTQAEATTIIQVLGLTGSQAAAIQALVTGGGGATTSCTFTRSLTIGATGSDVTCLQQALISMGFSIPAGATGYFGAQTQGAVASWQTSKGVTPPAGYFGPISQAAWGTSGPGTPSTPGGPLQGTEGFLEDESELGDVESVVDEGDTEKVLGVEFDAEESDHAIQRVEVQFDLAASTGSVLLSRYITEVNLILNGKEIGSMSASQGSRSGSVWTFRFTGLNGIAKMGETSQLYVEVQAVSSINDGDKDKDITVTIPANGIRVVDAAGISETYFGSLLDATFQISDASAGDLDVLEGSGNPKANTVKADVDTTTSDVLLMEFDLRADNQDIIVRDLPVRLTATGANVSDIVQSLTLKRGSTSIKTKTVASSNTTATTTFDGIDEEIADGDRETYRVYATVKKLTTTGGILSAGDTLTASTSQGANWVVEDQEGENVTPDGSVTGGAITFLGTDVTVSLVGTPSFVKTAGSTGVADTVTYTITFRVDAGDDDIWIPGAVSASNRSVNGNANLVTWATTTSSSSGGATTNGAANLSASGSNNGDINGNYKVNSGSSRTFTLNVTLAAEDSSTGGFAGVRLTGVGYDIDSTVNNTVTTSPYATGLDDFKTTDASLKDN